MTLCKDTALIVHLVGHKVQKPGTDGAKFSFSNKASCRGENFKSLEISPTVSKA